jgi:hypothetical protein
MIRDISPANPPTIKADFLEFTPVNVFHSGNAIQDK